MISSRTALISKLVERVNCVPVVIIYGEAGGGKTFFLEVLCKELEKRNKIIEPVIRNAWEVANSHFKALCDEDPAAWRDDLLSSDAIIIDDFHVYHGQRVITEELNKIFRSTYKPIMITTSLPISEDNFPCPDLVSFLRQGALVNLNVVSQPEIAEHLHRSLKTADIKLPYEATDWLMQNISSIAAISGIVNTLELYRETSDKPMTLVDCKELLLPLLAID